MVRLLAAFLLAGHLSTAQAAEWQASEILPKGSVESSQDMVKATSCKDGKCTFEKIEPTARKQADNGLPDGHIATTDFGTIRSAWYAKPVTHYRHGILGDAIEAETLVAAGENGDTWSLPLKDGMVFEDRTPRIVDPEGLGKNKIVTIMSAPAEGAAIAVFAINDGKLVLESQTPFIGTSNRWRNIAGIADFDGDGSLQIAEVVTPHIGGTLRFWTFKKDKLVPSGEMFGFSNHEIGAREQDLSAVEDFDGDGVSDLALPSADRRVLRLMRFSGGANGEKTLEELASVRLPARIDKAIGVTRNGDDVVLTVGLEDGSVYAIHQ